METKEIAALLEALCERPLADGQPEPAEFRAFCREALDALSQAGNDPVRSAATGAADPDRLTAALAALIAGPDTETARRTVEEAVLRSAAARLDAQSALAFVEAVEQAPQAAPAELVEEMLAADRAAAAPAGPRAGAGASALWSLITGASWSARRWRMAAAFTVVLAAGAASWSTFWQPSSPAGSGPSVAKSAREQLADPAAAARPALARAQPESVTARPCPPRIQTGAARTGDAAPAAGATPPSADTACGSDHQLADGPGSAIDAMIARQRAEAARQAAAERAAAEAAAKFGAEQADRAEPTFDALGRHPAAAAGRAPAAMPAMPAMPPPLGAR